ncbi:serine protease [Branchiibius sp. NY16-3462-2]|uniref:S1 family peptidase n=1 Tax=Branchiibius sp. NY16-3462-2 TaxID=1807500 RepID=UPI0007941E3E|nr:serine protease [Branchiibius sp. NY16-3462-2]KYH45426.1 hypothetical protein AZH51_01875 [Branchiibius sp. NY16-3462-2]
MITAEIFCRVLRVQTEHGQQGTGFLFDHEDGLALITAAHLCSGEREELIGFKQTWADTVPKMGYLTRIGDLAAAGDVAAFEIPEYLWPDWLVGSVPLQSDGVAYGQDCYLLGMPTALLSPIGTDGNEVCIIRKGIIAGRDVGSRDSPATWYVDAFALPGFSGGPLVLRSVETNQYHIAGVVQGSATTLFPAGSQQAVPTGISYCTDTDHVLALGLRNKAI